MLSIQIPYRGDEYLFQGISSAGQSLGQGLQQMGQHLQKLKMRRTMLQDLLAQSGQDPAQAQPPDQPEGISSFGKGFGMGDAFGGGMAGGGPGGYGMPYGMPVPGVGNGLPTRQ